MHSRRLATAVLCGCLLALPALAADKKGPNADPGKDVDGDNLSAGQFTGKLTTTPGTDGSFTVNVESDRIQAKPNAARNENREVQQLVRDQERIDRLQADLARARNANEYRRRLQDLAEAIQRMQVQGLRDQVKSNGDVKVVKEYKEIDFHTAGDVKVRTANLPVQFDDKGNAKEYTKDELKALKGKDADLPGYEAALDSLKVGDKVRVTLAHPKADKKDADNDPKKDADAKKVNQVTLILILSEDTGDAGKGKKK